jgi:aldehyde:ferredoxin oxidoreductase
LKTYTGVNGKQLRWIQLASEFLISIEYLMSWPASAAGMPKGRSMPQAIFEKALAEYYALRGWDTQGRPSVEKLEELGVEKTFIAE